MLQDWSFWHSQLSGNDPQTTPGAPHSGYFMLRRLLRWPNTDPNRVGKSRTKQKEIFIPVAIWFDDGWHCRIGADEYITDVATIDEVIFCRCCRAAITYDEYLIALEKL